MAKTSVTSSADCLSCMGILRPGRPAWGYYLLSLASILLLNTPGTRGDFSDPYLRLNVTFDPPNVDQLVQEDIRSVTIVYELLSDRPVLVRVRSADTGIAEVYGSDLITFTPSADSNNNNSSNNNTLQVKGIFLGRTKLIFASTNVTEQNVSASAMREEGDGKSVGDGAVSGNGLDDAQWRDLPFTYAVTVIREDGPLNTAFLVSIILLVVLANIAMGCKVELALVKEILRRPLAPAIGLCSQFIIMPLLGFAASQMFNFDSGTALGLFATGLAPGGGASNAYTFLLDGDVSLSVTMTLISTLASFAFIPLWLFTIGTRVLYKDSDVRIPYENIFTSLIGLILPVVFGLLIRWKRPQWVRNILRAVTPLMVLVLLVILSVGIYANLYIFKLLRAEVLAAGAILPNFGFVLGGLAGFVFRQPWQRVKTIAIETGLQNTGIPIVLLQVSLPKPDSDFAIVAPVAAAIFTPVFLWIWILARFVKKKCFNKSAPEPGKLTTDGVNMAEHDAVDQSTPESPSGSPSHLVSPKKNTMTPDDG